jgi:outer membrane receptor protein involved in Fe transport
VKSKSTLIVNLGLGYRINQTWRLTGEVLNLLNRHDHDIDYYYQSQNSPKPGSPAPNEDHFHAVESIGFRLGFETKL